MPGIYLPVALDRWTAAFDHRGWLCMRSFTWVWAGARRLAGVGAVCGVWAVLWHGLWNRQRAGGDLAPENLRGTAYMGCTMR